LEDYRHTFGLTVHTSFAPQDLSSSTLKKRRDCRRRWLSGYEIGFAAVSTGALPPRRGTLKPLRRTENLHWKENIDLDTIHAGISSGYLASEIGHDSLVDTAIGPRLLQRALPRATLPYVTVW
jgi:hypothetical protein